MEAPAATLDARTAIGAVRLRVADLDRVQAFYERAIGLETIERDASEVHLGAGERRLVELAGDAGAPKRPRGTTGLFHLAILVPGRAHLAAALRRIAEADSGLTGASDHLVSEALYLQDPEGNGIEIYRDRPREEWPRENGEVRMATLPLDLAGLLGDAEPGGPGPMAPGTRMGHVHLNVADIPAAEAFYAGGLGFDVTVRGYPGALFVSAGGYHHHLGLNTWVGEGAPPPPPGSRGLEHYEITVPDGEELAPIARRLEAAGVEAPREGDALRFADPFRNGILLRAAGP